MENVDMECKANEETMLAAYAQAKDALRSSAEEQILQELIYA